MTRTLRTLRPVLALFLAEHRRLLLTGIALSAATVLAGIALLGLSGWFITATAIAGLSVTTALAFDVFAPSAGIRFLALARTASRYGERLVTHEATLHVLAALRERLFRGWAAPRAARRLALRPARLLFRLTADVDALDSLYLRLIVPLGAALCAALAVAVSLSLMHPLLGLAAGALLLLAGIGFPLVAARRAGPAARRKAHAVEALRSRTVDLVQGQTDLAMAGRLAAQARAVTMADERLSQADDALNRTELVTGAGLGAVNALMLAGTLVAVAVLVEQGAIGAPVAALALLIVFAAMEPFLALRRGAVEIGRTLLAARRIGPRLAPVAPEPAPASPPAGFALVLTDVSAGHDETAAPVLTGITLSLARGERLAVIGASGAGKSTLLGLLAGEILPRSGHAAALPATLLTQRTELFQDSLRGNLALADPTADEGRMRACLLASGLDSDLEALPGGLDARLGEGGAGLSGGQSRRLALARLLLRDRPLWLLDEPTEGLDGATARDVLQRLSDWGRERTIVIATHIRREAELADRLVVIEGGRIVTTEHRGTPGFARTVAALRPD